VVPLVAAARALAWDRKLPAGWRGNSLTLFLLLSKDRYLPSSDTILNTPTRTTRLGACSPSGLITVVSNATTLPDSIISRWISNHRRSISSILGNLLVLLDFFTRSSRNSSRFGYCTLASEVPNTVRKSPLVVVI